MRSRHAATSCATPRERRDMLRMSPSRHHASSGSRAVARSPRTSSHSERAHSRRPISCKRWVRTAWSSRRWATSLTAYSSWRGDIGRSIQSDRRSALGSDRSRTDWTRRDRDGDDIPRKPATTWVSKTVTGATPHAGGEDVEVLSGGVGHGDTGSGEDAGERGGVDGERVDQGHAAGPGELDEGEVRHIGPLGVELGIEAVGGLSRQLDAQVFECARVGHHAERRRRRPPVAVVCAGHRVVGAPRSDTPACWWRTVRRDGSAMTAFPPRPVGRDQGDTAVGDRAGQGYRAQVGRIGSSGPSWLPFIL